MPEMTLREGTAADVAAMYALDLLCFQEPFQFDLRAMRSFVTQPGAIVLVAAWAAASGDAMLGFVVVNMNRRGAYVTTLDVHPDCRRLGVARKLVAEAERRAAEAGAGIMALHVYVENRAAIALYEAAGYVQGSRVRDFYGRGMDGFGYRKQLG
jgi:ribosomal-protein-alanine N-acetyltransferase